MQVSLNPTLPLRPAAAPGSSGPVADPVDPGPESGRPAPAEPARAASENTTRMTLSEAELRQVQALRQRDREVRAHEQAHAAAAGGYARGGPSYDYQRGPDGRNYAVGGEVQIDTAPVPGDPAATLRKMEVVRRAAMAPAEPSSQDRAIAAEAAAAAAQARAELQRQMATERAGGTTAAPAAPRLDLFA